LELRIVTLGIHFVKLREHNVMVYQVGNCNVGKQKYLHSICRYQQGISRRDSSWRRRGCCGKSVDDLGVVKIPR
jgi:hypothetical protein